MVTPNHALQRSWSRNCAARGRFMRTRTRHASAPLPVREPPLNSDVRHP